MIYFDAKQDLEFIRQFKKDAVEMIEIENNVQTGRSVMLSPSEYRSMRKDKASENPKYQEIRDRVAKDAIHAVGLAQKAGIPIIMHSYPAPAIGGPVIPINLFLAILNDTSHGGVEPRYIIDALNQTIGQYERIVERQFRQMINPFYWVKLVALHIIRLPHTVLSFSGFDVAKIEQELWAKLLNLIWIVAVIWILISFGFDLQQILSVIVTRGK